jgi:ketosteroid isomerase-like protein
MQHAGRLPFALSLVAASVVASVALAVAGCGAHSFGKKDDSAIRNLLGAQQQAWNSGNLDGYMAGYLKSDELVFTSEGLIRKGWDETYAKYRERYGTDRATMGTLVFDIVSIQSLGGDGAIVLGRWKLTDTPEPGDGIFSVALRRTAKGWRIVHDHTTANPKPVVP